jgi:hypothetical protein
MLMLLLTHCIHLRQVFRTRQILRLDPDPWIRELDYRSESCSFRQWLSKCQQKISVFQIFVLLITYRRYIYILSLQDKIFLKFLAFDGRIRIQIRIRKNNYGSGRIKNLRIRIRTTALRQWFLLTFECVWRVLDSVWELVPVQLKHLQLTQLQQEYTATYLTRLGTFSSNKVNQRKITWKKFLKGIPPLKIYFFY